MSMKALVTGAAGLLGGFLHAELSRFADVAAGVHSKPARNAAKTVGLDIEDKASIAAAIDGKGYSVVVHAAAVRTPEDCLNDPARAYRINAAAVEHIAECCRKNAVKLVYVSTDYVFPGVAPPYAEDCRPLPVNVYGRSKLAGEYVARSVEKHLITRIPALWNNDPEDAASPLKGFVDKFRAGKPFPVENKLVRHYSLASDIAGAIAFCVEKDMAGIIHLSAGESQTKADFARAAGRHYGFDPNLAINSGPGENEDRRPFDSSLDTALYRSRGGPHIRGVSEAFADMR